MQIFRNDPIRNDIENGHFSCCGVVKLEMIADEQWIRLRYVAVLGQVLTLLITSFYFHFDLPLRPLFFLTGLTFFSNLFFQLKKQQCSERMFAWGQCFDVLNFSGLLYFSGGAYNPFSFLYLIHIVFAAFTLNRLWNIIVLILSLVCFFSLLWFFVPLIHPEDMDHFTIHTRGMWLAYAVASAVLLYFVRNAIQVIDEKNKALQEVNASLERQKRLVSLGTLAASAAHELATPLSSISLIVGEMFHHQSKGTLIHLDSDLLLLRQETDKMKSLMAELSLKSGHISGELNEWVSIEQMMLEACNDFKSAVDIHLHTQVQVFVPPLATKWMFKALMKNAIESQEGAAPPIQVDVRFSSGFLTVVVKDLGKGMTHEQIKELGNPFFSTKLPEQGMGLGVFLAKTFVESLDGSISFDSVLRHGTSVTVKIPEDRVKT